MVIAATSVILGLQLLMFYKVSNVGVSAIIFSMTIFASTLCAVILTGGWTSPVKQLFICAPVISFLIGGRQEDIATSHGLLNQIKSMP